jgi:acyl transferase domain-containing protein
LLSGTINGTNGAMMAVAMGESEVQGYIDQVCEHFTARDLFIGCINSPVSTTITGGAEQVDALHKVLTAQGVFARKLKVDVAYHSPHMKSIASKYHSLVNDLGNGKPYGDVPIMVSTVTGLVVEQEELRNPGYWVQNSLSTVRFSQAIKTLSQLEQGPEGKYQKSLDITALVEIGPHSTLQGPIKDTLKEVSRGVKIEYYSCLLRKNPADKSLLDTLGRLRCHGIPMNLRKINQTMEQWSHPPSVLSDLPEYQFNHSKTYWHEGRLSKEARFRRNARLDLLGKPVIDWNPHEARWRNFIRFSELPWTKAHKVDLSISRCTLLTRSDQRHMHLSRRWHACHGN